MSASSAVTNPPAAAVDPQVLQALHGKVLGDCNAGIGGLLAFLGDKLGLFRLLADAGPLTTAQVAERAGVNERMVREWLAAVAAAGYVTYQPEGERFGVTPEQAVVFASEGHPAFLQGPIDLIYSLYHDEPKLRDAFRHGRGVAWGDHNACLFCSAERFFGPLYRSSILHEWLPAIDGVVDTLRRGADVADVGCGHGTSALIMAEAFAASRFSGFDSHAGSIDAARRAAADAGVNDRVRFETGSAKEYGGQFDLICFFDALHDMGDPVGAAAHARKHLKPGGVVMLVEPYAEDRLEDNLSSARAPVSRFFYAASTLACVPASQAQEVGRALGAQAGPRRLTAVLQEAGFGRVRVAARTAMNLVFEARI
jgi:SAM-dependent methyltransferase